MNRTLAKKMINNLKDGTIYGIFNTTDDTIAVWYMLYNMGKIYVHHYGNYCMPCTIDNLLDWFTWKGHEKLYIKPVKWHEKKVCYVAC